MTPAGSRRAGCSGRGLVAVDLLSARSLQDVAGFPHFLGGSMCDKNELAGFDRRLVFYDAVLGNAEAEEPSTESTDPSHDDCALQGPDDPVDNGAGSNNRPDAWDD